MKRTNTVGALRAAITGLNKKIEALKDERFGLYRSLAVALCPLEVGDRFTAEGAAWKDNMRREITRADVFVVTAVAPLGHGRNDPKTATWHVVAKRVLKSGAHSEVTYYIVSENHVRKVKKGGGDK